MNQAQCKRCGGGMKRVAEIAPFGPEPGLVAFLCSDCGATESTLLPVNKRQVQHAENVEFRLMPTGEGPLVWASYYSCPTVIARGVADTEPAACQHASETARKAKLIE